MKQDVYHVLAVDIGASTGRAMLATLENGSLALQEVHRFENTPVNLCGTLHWDVLRLWHEVKQSVQKAAKLAPLHSIGVDTWGVDFALLDQQGRLMENPVHYRDGRTAGMAEKAAALLDREALYRATGNQIMDINTAFQLMALQEQRPGLLPRAATLLLMPDLLAYFLTGNISAEESIASTTQLYDPAGRGWHKATAAALGLPGHILPPVRPAGSRAGMLAPHVCRELGVPPCPVTLVCGHDTQSALVAVPAGEEDFLFLSSGTWSLMGTELDAPVTDSRAMAAQLTNESAFGGKTAFLKNITGLWLVQESRRQWQREGQDYTFARLEEMARAEAPFQSFIPPSHPDFSPPGDLPGRIAAFCKKTGQPVPQSPGAVVRCIAESLAMEYRRTAEEISGCTGKQYDGLYIVGGGVKDSLLCGMAASACGMAVHAGPAEATTLGNAAVQLIGLGAVAGLRQARGLVAKTQSPARYSPGRPEEWSAAYKTFKEAASC